MSRFTNDVDAVGEMLSNTVVQLIAGAVSIVGTFALMIYTNVWLTLITRLYRRDRYRPEGSKSILS